MAERPDLNLLPMGDIRVRKTGKMGNQKFTPLRYIVFLYGRGEEKT